MDAGFPQRRLSVQARSWNSWIQNLYAVPVAGGMPTPLPIDGAVGLATFGPDGHSIAYNRIFRNFRTWKRYNGGLAQQVFTYDFNSHALKQLTNWSGTNTSPMWYGARIYYLSDQDAHRRANIWVLDTDTKQTRQVTHFNDYDIDFPALGGDAIAFQQGGKLYRLDLPSEHIEEVPLTIPDDGPRMRARVANVKSEIAQSIRRARWISRWRRTASGPYSRRAAISSACRQKMARRAI